MLEPGDHEQPRDLRPLFSPRSVAVVGASADTSKWGGDIAARLVYGRQAAGVPRQPARRRPARPPRVCLPPRASRRAELVVLAMPAASLDAVLTRRSVSARKHSLASSPASARRAPRAAPGSTPLRHGYGPRARCSWGPNCMGLADQASGFEAVAYLDIPPGDVAFVSQSGAMGEEFVMRARAWGCGFSRYVTLGNQADVGAVEILESLDHASGDPGRGRLPRGRRRRPPAGSPRPRPRCRAGRPVVLWSRGAAPPAHAPPFPTPVRSLPTRRSVDASCGRRECTAPTRRASSSS